MSLFSRRRPSDLMSSDPRMDALRAKALNRTSEDSMRAYGRAIAFWEFDYQ